MTRAALHRVVLCLVAIGALPFAPPQAVRDSTVIDSRQLLRDLRTLSADDMEGRQVDTPGGAKARAFVLERFQESGVTPFGTSYSAPFVFTTGRYGSPERHGVNIVGHIDGTQKPVRYIVVSAHYDHVGVRNGVVYNGADDNASGTAALFALAKYFSSHKPTHALIFVAFDAEETGLNGSQAFVKQPPVDAAALVLDVNLDMIGRDPDNKLFIIGTRENPALKPLVEQITASAPVKLLIGHDDPGDRKLDDWTRDSDSYSFVQAKIPALFLSVEDYAQHHKPTDDYETMTYAFYVGAVETALAIVKTFDEHLDELPRGGR